MFASKKNRCRICQKVFCCPDCRDNHENSKHPKPKCSLCMGEALPFKVDAKEDSLKKSEIVCHVVFNHLPLRCKLCGDTFKKSTDLLGAQICRWWDGKRRKSNIDTSSIIIHQKQDNFDSPLELTRHTSTPMHQSVLALPGQKLPLGVTGLIPQFSLKTPTSFDQGSSLSGTASSCSDFESRYYTGSSQLSSAEKNDNNNKYLDRNQSEVDPSWNSPTYSILKKQLEPLNVMKPEGMDSIEKRVRFSDQCIVTPTTASTTALESSCSSPDSDIFFEAQETFEDEIPKKDSSSSNNNNNNNNNNDDDEDKKVVLASEEAGKSEACACYRESGETIEKKESSTSNPEQKNTSSSRVVMMLLVEKIDSSESLTNLDLAPLIETGLKKLEEGASKLNVEVVEKKTVIKDTFFGKSEKPRASIETRQESQIEEVSLQVQEEVGSSSSSHKSDGIFSAMARVVISALKKLPAVGSGSGSSSTSMSSAARNLSREPLPPSGIPSTPPLSIASSYSATTSSRIILQRSASKRPRDRVDSSAEELQLQPRAPAAGNNISPRRQEIASSPAAKRHRGWYRIRAREPIARMREHRLVPQSPRGASRETQRFQQGSLTIGDILLPLPSRAHQSTQTDN